MTARPSTTELPSYDELERAFGPRLRTDGSLRMATRQLRGQVPPIHGWYPFAQSFSPRLVSHLLQTIMREGDRTVLDPFSGVGTTVIEAQSQGFEALGLEIMPLFKFVADVKLERGYDMRALRSAIDSITVRKTPPSDPEAYPVHPIFLRAFEPSVLHDLLSLRSQILLEEDDRTRNFLLLGLLSSAVEVSRIRKAGAHYRFVDRDTSGVRHQFGGPVAASSESVINTVRTKWRRMMADLVWVMASSGGSPPRARVFVDDARVMKNVDDNSVAMVVTSPPYLNRDNYVAQHKIELFLAPPPVGVDGMKGYRELTFSSLRSHVEARDAVPRGQHEWTPPQVLEIADELRERDLNYKQIPEMVEGYFQDMSLVIMQMRRVLRPGGVAGIVVGNVRFAGLHIPVDFLLASTARLLGLQVQEIIVVRKKLNSPQQMRDFGKFPVRESVVVLRKEGAPRTRPGAAATRHKSRRAKG